MRDYCPHCDGTVTRAAREAHEDFTTMSGKPKRLHEKLMSKEPVVIGFVPFLKTIWNLFWTAFVHPCTNTVIDMTTGDIIRNDEAIDERMKQ